MREPLPSHFDEIRVERRRSHRENVVALGKLYPLDASDTSRPIQVLVTEVSLHGCDLKAALPPRDGAFYRIEMSVGPLSLTSRLRVIRLVGKSDGTFAVSGEFI